LVQIQP